MEVADAKLFKQKTCLLSRCIPNPTLLFISYTIHKSIAIAFLVVTVLDHLVLCLILVLLNLWSCLDSQCDSRCFYRADLRRICARA